MSSLAKALAVLSAVAFVLAVLTSFTGVIAGISPEGFSRACTNLALLAIAMAFLFKGSSRAGGSS